MQLRPSASTLDQPRSYSLYRVDLEKARMTEQTQASDTKDGVKDVDHIARTIRHATVIRILLTVSDPSNQIKSKDTDLAFENEVAELLSVNPMQPLDHG